MKKTIITTVALVALAFVACKKDNLQPTTNSTNIETTIDDDKVVDARNKFVGVFKNSQMKLTISKATSSQLKVVIKYTVGGTRTCYGKVVTSNKNKFQVYPYQSIGDLGMLEGLATQITGSTVKKLKATFNYTDMTSSTSNLVRQ